LPPKIGKHGVFGQIDGFHYYGLNFDVD